MFAVDTTLFFLTTISSSSGDRKVKENREDIQEVLDGHGVISSKVFPSDVLQGHVGGEMDGEGVHHCLALHGLTGWSL